MENDKDIIIKDLLDAMFNVVSDCRRRDDWPLESLVILEDVWERYQWQFGAPVLPDPILKAQDTLTRAAMTFGKAFERGDWMAESMALMTAAREYKQAQEATE